jgi:hypothetical protein
MAKHLDPHSGAELPMVEAYSTEWYNAFRGGWDQARYQGIELLQDINLGGIDVLVKPDIVPTCALDPRTNIVYVNPLFLDPEAEQGTFTFVGDDPQASINRGAMLHEASHAMFSKISLGGMNTLDKKVSTVIMFLEELRIEYNMMNTIGNSKRLDEAGYSNDLRAGSHYIVTQNLPGGAMDPVQLSASCALTLGRRDAGIISDEAAEPLVEVFESIYGAELLRKLRALWIKSLSLTDRDMATRIKIAKAWLDLLDQDTSEEDGTPDKSKCSTCGKPKPEKGEKGEPQEGEGSGEGDEEGEEGDAEGSGKGEGEGDECEGHGGDGEGDGEGEGEGEGEGGEGGDSDKINDALSHSYQITETNIMEDNKNREQAARRAWINSADARRKNRSAAAEKATDKSHGFGGGSAPGHYGERLYRTPEKPTTEERRAMVRLAQELDRVTYVDKHTTKVNTILPPGRMRGRAAVAMAAQKDKGLVITAEPWRSKRRKSVDKTPLTVGIIADVSGSMSSSVNAVSTAAWMLSEGVNRVHGKTATVLMGDTAYGLIKPGERHELIPRYNACFGYEAFKDSYDAVDGLLNLSGGRGARILFVVTDSCLVSGEHEKYAWTAMKEAKAAGVQVFWLDFDKYHEADRYKNYGYGEIIGVEPGNVVANATLIGQTVIKAFDRVKNV